LAAAGLTYNDLDFLLFTHFHPDHTGDLPAYLFATRYWPGFTRLKPSRIVGPQGLSTLIGHFKSAWSRWVDPMADRVFVEEWPMGVRSVHALENLQVESGPMHHNPESLGYRFTFEGRSLVVTGDTDYGPNLAALAQGADLLVTECSFPEGRKREGHLTPREAGRAAREAGVNHLVLTHFYPETQGHDLMGPLMEEYGGPITLAEDFLEMRLEPPVK
jgi:ribonuclease BN (tRNA processing enzyme)